MAAQWFHLKPPVVRADQFQQSKPPWPAGVDTCQDGGTPGQPHLHIAVIGSGSANVITTPIHDGDWVITAESGSLSVMSDADFETHYAPAPPAVSAS